MKALPFAPIVYQIAMYGGGSLDVAGYAVDLPAPLDWLHICVRKQSPGDWTVDHYETGIGITGPLLSATGIYTAKQLAFAERYRFDHRTRDGVTRSAIRWLLHLHGRGELRARIERAIAGDLGATRAYRDETLVAIR